MSKGNGFGETTFREKPDISQVFLRQLDRTNHAASIDYANSVIQKLNNLPSQYRDWVIDHKDEYEVTTVELVSLKNCGVAMGTEDNPILYDETQLTPRFPDGTIDYNHPNVMSPKFKEITRTDYTQMDALIMQAAENAGLTWSVDKEFVVVGQAALMPPFTEATPLFRKDLTEKQLKRLVYEHEEEETES